MKMGKIHELPRTSSRVLTSSQIISSVFCVVKELVENALDSEAKNVEVKLEDYGFSKIEVKDDGCGIDKNDLEFVARPHFTSKITSFSDLGSVQSYGFRGEALGAICAVADLVITTKSENDNVASMNNFDCNGLIISTKPCPFNQGTAVSILNLFKNIPVRRQFYRSDKNKKEDLRKVEELLAAYGIIHNGVRFSLLHNKNIIWQKTALPSTKDAVIQAFGSTVFENLKHVQYQNDETHIEMDMYLPKIKAHPLCGFSSSSRCIVVINKRPVRLKAIDKLLKESYNASIQNSGRSKYPVCYVAFTLPSIEVDVNIEPNKTSVMLHNSEEIISQFSNLLKAFYKTEEEVEHPASNDETSALVGATSGFQSISNENFLSTSNTLTGNHSTTQPVAPSHIQRPSLPFYADQPMNKKDIHIVSSSQPSKKKQKTGSHSSKDLGNHLNSLRNFFACSDINPENNVSGVNTSVTVHRTPSQNNSFSESESSFFNQKKISDFTSSTDSFQFSTNSEKDLESLVVDTSISEDENFLNRNGTVSKTTTINMQEAEVNLQKSGDGSDFILMYESGSRNESQVSSIDDEIESRISNQNRLVLENNSTDQSEINVSVLSQEPENCNLWSRGVLPSGAIMQPVAVLQPKTAALSKNVIVEKQKLQNASLKQVSLSFERKLTAFDVFCRCNRLEIAAAGPELNNQQIAQMLSEKWSQLKVEEKAVYKNMLDKEYPKDIKRKEKLGKTISQNLSQVKSGAISSKNAKKKFKMKRTSTEVILNLEQIKKSFRNKSVHNVEEFKSLEIIGHLTPGIWICKKECDLSTLNTFCLQEIIIYHRLLETFQFEAEPLETPVVVPESQLGDEVFDILSQLQKDSNGNVSDERLTANGFNIKFIESEDGCVCVQVLGILKYIAYYGVSDLRDCLLLIKKNGFSLKLSDCRPAKVIFYLQSEANRMCRQSPPIQRKQDVEDLLVQKGSVIPNADVCIHQKAFFHKLWTLDKNQMSGV